MKGIKLGIVGICISLAGIACASNNFLAIVGAGIGLVVSVIGYFLDNDKTR